MSTCYVPGPPTSRDLYQRHERALVTTNSFPSCFVSYHHALLLRGMALVLPPTPTSPLATSPQVIDLLLLRPQQRLNLDVHRSPQQSKVFPLSSPTNIARHLPRTRSRTRISARASLERIVEESPGDSLDSHSARPIPQAAPGSTRDSEHTPASRPLSWNGKNGINVGRGMRDVCGIWCVELFAPGAVRPQVC